MSGSISEKALTRQEILPVDKQRVEREKFLFKKFFFKFFITILKRFGAYFKLHQPNHPGLGIIGNVSSCSTIEHKCRLSQVKVMTSQVGHMPR